jgi:hypothetical protein
MMIALHVLFLALTLLSAAQETPSLESVLKKMETAAANFHTAQISSGISIRRWWMNTTCRRARFTTAGREKILK